MFQFTWYKKFTLTKRVTRKINKTVPYQITKPATSTLFSNKKDEIGHTNFFCIFILFFTGVVIRDGTQG